MILQLPVRELDLLMAEIEERLERVTMMELAETGFQEWNPPEEDICDVEFSARRSVAG